MKVGGGPALYRVICAACGSMSNNAQRFGRFLNVMPGNRQQPIHIKGGCSLSLKQRISLHWHVKKE